MEFQKLINSIDITSDDKDLLKKGSKFMIDKKKNYSINSINITVLIWKFGLMLQ